MIATPGGRIGVVQIAGLVARRIVCFVREGESIGAGERFGMIRFGSRLDVYLPEGAAPLVAEARPRSPAKPCSPICKRRDGRRAASGWVNESELDGCDGGCAASLIGLYSAMVFDVQPFRRTAPRAFRAIPVRTAGAQHDHAARALRGPDRDPPWRWRTSSNGRSARSCSPRLLDGIDGRVARLLKGQSRFGAELDSLADFVNFGVAPG